MFLIFIAVLIYFIITRDCKKHFTRIITQVTLTIALGFILSAVGNANLEGGWVPLVGLVGLIIYYGSFGFLFNFLYKLPKR